VSAGKKSAKHSKSPFSRSGKVRPWTTVACWRLHSAI